MLKTQSNRMKPLPIELKFGSQSWVSAIGQITATGMA
jgi:hypothetical protein